MEWLLYTVVRLLLALVQVLPLRAVARLGRAGGALAYWLDARHRRVARRNLELVFAREKSPAELRALARENFKRIGENFACAARTAFMTDDQLRPYLEVTGTEHLKIPRGAARPGNRIVAVGHFGNFELSARNPLLPEAQFATTYRGLRQPSLDRLLRRLRERSRCLYFERRTQGNALREALRSRRIVLGLLCDQHAGRRGLRLRFFGRECSTSPAPALFALRNRCPLHVALCYRTGLAQWRVEFSEEIPTCREGRWRTLAEIMGDVNQAFERAVRRDPANWFWVHNRWKALPARAAASPAENSAPNVRPLASV